MVNARQFSESIPPAFQRQEKKNLFFLVMSFPGFSVPKENQEKNSSIFQGLNENCRPNRTERGWFGGNLKRYRLLPKRLVNSLDIKINK